MEEERKGGKEEDGGGEGQWMERRVERISIMTEGQECELLDLCPVKQSKNLIFYKTAKAFFTLLPFTFINLLFKVLT